MQFSHSGPRHERDWSQENRDSGKIIIDLSGASRVWRADLHEITLIGIWTEFVWTGFASLVNLYCIFRVTSRCSVAYPGN
jgi:hypothetical protein